MPVRTQPAWLPATTTLRRGLLLAAWVAALWLLVGSDGGRWPVDQPPILLLSAVAAATAIPELSRVHRSIPVLAIATVVGLLVAFAAAEVRAGWVASSASLTIAVALGTGVIALWQDDRTRRIVGVVLVVLAVRSWYLGALSWWGGALGRTRWLSLSFENQSGPLVAAIAMVGFGMAVAQRGWIRAVGVMLAGIGLSAAWLSGSRGTVVLLVPTLQVLLIAALRMVGTRRALTGLGAGLLVALLLVPALTWERAPETSRVEAMVVNPKTDTRNLVARFRYWDAAIAMVRTEPWTGTGPGSFRWSAAPFWRDDVELTASPHNEYLGAFAERGVIGGVPVAATAVGIAWLGLLLLRRRSGSEVDPSRGSARLGSLGAATILGLHAGMDFDWDYPLLAAALALAGGVLAAEHAVLRPPRRAAGTGFAVTAGALTATALLMTSIGLRIELSAGPAAWDLDAALREAVAAAESEDTEAALPALERATRWNPGSWSLPVVTAVVDHARGGIDDAELRVQVGPRSTAMGDQTLVARRLIAVGAHEPAADILEQLRPVVASRPLWGVEVRAAEVALLSLEVTAQRVAGATAETPAWEQPPGSEVCRAIQARWREREVPWLDQVAVDTRLVAAAWNDRDGASCRLGSSHR